MARQWRRQHVAKGCASCSCKVVCEESVNASPGDLVTQDTETYQAGTPLLQAGLTHHRAGRLQEAARCYEHLLEVQPLNADALNLLGVIARQQNDLDTSERLILRAIRQNADMATYHHHLGKTYAQMGRPDDAAQSYRRALSLNPEDRDSLQLLALLLSEAADRDGAAALYGQLLELEPDRAEWMFRLGHIRKCQGRISEALVWYRQAVSVHPDAVDSQFNLGKALFEARQLEESQQCFRLVIAMQPEDVEAHNFLGQILHELGEAGEAQQMYLEALRLRPDSVEALSNLGALLLELGELQYAEALLRRALTLAPDFLCACNNLGTVLARQGRFAEAFQTFRNILLTDPTNVQALCSMGFSLDALGDLDGARECFQLALTSEPDSALTRFNLSPHLLLAGNFAEGWSWYERRWELRQFTGKPRRYAQPRWQGEEIAGASIFLFSEQGLGDTLQFVRYALLLVDRGAQVWLEVQPPLYPLLRYLHPRIHVFVKDQEDLSATDWHCPLLSLPMVFGTDLSNIPAIVPYLHAGEVKAKYWAEALGAPGLRVGLVWSGNPEHVRDRLRSVPFEQFRSLLSTPGVSFYSLQKGKGAAQAQSVASHGVLHDLEPYLLDFTDTAAIIANLDLVITVDTAVAHLAGAMGKPVWILLAHAPDWRWLQERSDSPWYPTARLFRQRSRGQWDDVLAQVREALHALACETALVISHNTGCR